LIALTFRIPMLLVGAILLLAALLSGRFFGNVVRTAVGKFSRAAVALPEPCRLSGFGVLPGFAHALRLLNPLSHPHPWSQQRRLIFWEPRSSALQACPVSTAPAVPDGATASAEQMAAAHSAFQSYDAAINSYAKCVDSAVARITKAVCRCCFGIGSPITQHPRRQGSQYRDRTGTSARR